MEILAIASPFIVIGLFLFIKFSGYEKYRRRQGWNLKEFKKQKHWWEIF